MMAEDLREQTAALTRAAVAGDPGAVGGWERRLADGAEELIEAVRDAPGDARVWSVLGPVPPAFWLRRMLSDVTVHRYDAAASPGLRTASGWHAGTATRT